MFDDFELLDEARLRQGVTLALLRPSKIVRLQISKAGSPDWTDEEVDKLMQSQMQGSLFDQDTEQRSIKLLRKIPFDFHYHYECRVGDATRTYKHKLVDWEAGALYWNVHHRSDWQEAFLQRFFSDFVEKDTLFLMGTIHRFPNQWLIVSVLYPPRPHDELAGQQKLF